MNIVSINYFNGRNASWISNPPNLLAVAPISPWISKSAWWNSRSSLVFLLHSWCGSHTDVMAYRDRNRATLVILSSANHPAVAGPNWWQQSSVKQ
jgi:hypothetical protein